MPPRKRLAKTLKVGVNRFEMVLLDCLVANTGGSFASHMRFALRNYVKQSTAIDVAALARSLENDSSDYAETEEERKALLADMRAFSEDGIYLPGPTIKSEYIEFDGKFATFGSTDADFETWEP